MCTSQTIRGSKAWNTLISKHMSKYYVTCLLSILLLSSPGLSPKWRSAGQLTRQVLSSKTPLCLLLNPSENLVYTPTSTSFFLFFIYLLHLKLSLWKYHVKTPIFQCPVNTRLSRIMWAIKIIILTKILQYLILFSLLSWSVSISSYP